MIDEATSLEGLADALEQWHAECLEVEQPPTVSLRAVARVLRVSARILDERMRPVLEGHKHLEGVAEGMAHRIDSLDLAHDTAREVIDEQLEDVDGRIERLRDNLERRIGNCEDDVADAKRSIDHLERS